jgi:hypothetical protein
MHLQTKRVENVIVTIEIYTPVPQTQVQRFALNQRIL